MTLCTSCGTEITETFRYCPECGNEQAPDNNVPKAQSVTPLPHQERSIQKSIKTAARFIGVMALAGILLMVFVAVMNNRTFPLEMLEFENASLLYEGHTPKGFWIQVTNNSDIGAKDIKIRIDILGKSETPINGTVVYLHEHVPPHSTREIGTPYLGIGYLPSKGEWSFAYTVQSAKKIAPWEPN